MLIRTHITQGSLGRARMKRAYRRNNPHLSHPDRLCATDDATDAATRQKNRTERDRNVYLRTKYIIRLSNH